jgi:hypothetical protein
MTNYIVETIEEQTRITTLENTDVLSGVRGAPLAPYDMSFEVRTLVAYIQSQVTSGTIVSFGSDRTAIASPANGQVFFDTDDGIVYQYATVGGWTAKMDFVSSAELTTAIATLVTQTQLTSAISTHTAAADPHPIYLTQTEATALFSPIGGDAQGGLRYNWSATTTATPAAGTIRFNNAILASVTQLFVHESDRNGTAQFEVLDVLATGTRIQVTLEDNEEIYAWFRVSGAVVDNGSDRTLPVAFVSSAGAFVAGEVTVNFLQIQGGGGHLIEVNGVAQTQRGKLNLVVTGATTTDDASGDRTVVNIPASGSGSAPVVQTFGNGTANLFTITHNKATRNVGVLVYKTASPNERVLVGVSTPTDNTVEISTSLVTPALNEYTAIVYVLASASGSTVSGGSGGGRVSLTANRTYYVRATGTRTGNLAAETDATTNIDADAFGTINNALSALKKLDLQGFIPTLSLGAGVFTESVVLPSLLGADTAILAGAGASSTTILYEAVGGAEIVVLAEGITTFWTLKDIKISSTANNKIGLLCRNAACNLSSVWLDTSWIDVLSGSLGSIAILGGYTISRNKLVAWYSNGTGNIAISASIIVSGAVDFSSSGIFCADGNPVVTFTPTAITGTATGVKFRANYGGKILSTIAESGLLGNSAGSQNNGNFYQI